MGFYQEKHSQHFNSSLDELWDFISNPYNLKLITPDYMGFDIVSKDLPDKIYEGMIISYKVSPLLGIKTTWVTKITHISDKHYFVDEQGVGPYEIWHHQHFLESTSKGNVDEGHCELQTSIRDLREDLKSSYYQEKIRRNIQL
jgi:ligand-binding SRPBCC domain-containing protein